MLKRSILCTFPNILLRTVRLAITSVALKRVKPLCAVILCSVMLLGPGWSASGTERSASGARPQVTLLTKVLDDFTTGQLQEPQILYAGGEQRDFQTGSMVGGFRTTFFRVTNSPLGQPGILNIRGPVPNDADQNHGYLVVGTGYKAFQGLQVVYGQDTQGQLNPLNQNFCLYDRFRVHFEGITGGVNLNIVVFTNNGRGRAAMGINVPPTVGGNEVDVDFPFADFIEAQPLPERPNWGDVDVIVLQPNSGGSARGGNDFAIRSFSVVCGNAVNCVRTCIL
jgi:hypothetical protein